MQTISDMYEQSLLAMAAYADFDSVSSETDALKRVGFSNSQVSQFLAKYEYLAKSVDTTTGFSGTFNSFPTLRVGMHTEAE